MANKTQSKKNSKIYYFILISMLVIVGLILIVAITNSNNPTTGNVVNSGNEDTAKSCKDMQIPYDYLEEYQETVPYTDRECENKPLTYSIIDFVLVSQ